MTDADERSFARFAAAMDAARDANAPQFTLYDDTPAAEVGSDLLWRALRRPLARRLGIGSAVGLVAVLLLTLLTPPIGAAIGWLTGPWSEPPPEQAAAAAPADAMAPADAAALTPEPAAGPDDPPPPTRALPVSADGAFAAAAQKVAEAPAARAIRVTGLDAAARPPAGSLPVPSFKPAPAGQ